MGSALAVDKLAEDTRVPGPRRLAERGASLVGHRRPRPMAKGVEDTGRGFPDSFRHSL